MMSSSGWRLVAVASQEVVEAALIAHEEADDWDPQIIISGSEFENGLIGEWLLEAWLPHKPTVTDYTALNGLFKNNSPSFCEEKLPEIDWVTHSQQGLEPVKAGKFYVHTPNEPGLGRAGVRDLCIPASQAFGTGQHATTAGCLELLSKMKAQGVLIRNLADIGTGTGLLAFAGLHLWPRAIAIASDIDPICLEVASKNAELNQIKIGAKQGQVVLVNASGMADRLLKARGPYDLITANILAGPLTEFAGDFAKALIPGGNLILAGLLKDQERDILMVYRRAGFRLCSRIIYSGQNDWPVLWLKKRSRHASKYYR